MQRSPASAARVSPPSPFLKRVCVDQTREFEPCLFFTDAQWAFERIRQQKFTPTEDKRHTLTEDDIGLTVSPVAPPWRCSMNSLRTLAQHRGRVMRQQFDEISRNALSDPIIDSTVRS